MSDQPDSIEGDNMNPGQAAPSARPVGLQPQEPEQVYRRRRRWLAGAIVLLALAAVIGLMFLPPRRKDQPEVKRSVTNVKVMRVVAADFPDTIDLPGVVEPNRTVTVSARVDGQVMEIKCIEGRPCRQGAEIVLLDTELLSAQVARADAEVKQFTALIAQAEAQRDFVRSERDSTKKLHAEGASTDLALQQAQDRLRAAEADVKRAEAGLAGAQAALKATEVDEGYATITAPIDGMLDKLMIEKGEVVSPGTPVARIVDAATVRVVVDVSQRDIRYVKLHQTAKVQVYLEPGAPDPKLTGKVDYISELADMQAKTTRVEVLVKNTPRVLRSGQIVRVALERRVIPQAIMVPLEALIQLESGRAVYIVDADSKARRRKVTLGIWRGRNVRILSGLQAGDMLIVQGHRYVGPGQTVKVRGEDPDPSSSDSPSARQAVSAAPWGRTPAGQS